MFDTLLYVITPEFIRGDEKFGQTIEAKFAEEYGININDKRIISYSSYWRVNEEFGYDLIVRIQDEVSSDHAPKEAPSVCCKRMKITRRFVSETLVGFVPKIQN